MFRSLTSFADSAWRAFRRWPVWAQGAGWLVGFWLLALVLLWRSSRPAWLKLAGSALAVLVVLALAAGGQEPGATGR